MCPVAQGPIEKLLKMAAYATHYREAYPGWKITIERMVAEGSWVVAQGVSTGKDQEFRFVGLLSGRPALPGRQHDRRFALGDS